MIERVEFAAEQVSITVQASSAHPDVLSVQDAMQQVLDFFELLTPEDAKETKFVWKLKIASTNSPFTVQGEAVSLEAGVNVVPSARSRKKFLADYFRDALAGRKPSRQFQRRKRTAVVRKILNRNTNGIGLTTASFGLGEDDIKITPTLAQIGIRIIDREENQFNELLGKRDRVENGSIEGTLVEVGTDYNQPAFLVRDRRTNLDVWCRVDRDLQDTISDAATFADVWEHRRVIVRGKLRYDSDGNLTRVYASSIRSLNARVMTLHDIADKEFSGKMGAAEYLSRLREGELGE